MPSPTLLFVYISIYRVYLVCWTFDIGIWHSGELKKGGKTIFIEDLAVLDFSHWTKSVFDPSGWFGLLKWRISVVDFKQLYNISVYTTPSGSFGTILLHQKAAIEDNPAWKRDLNYALKFWLRAWLQLHPTSETPHDFWNCNNYFLTFVSSFSFDGDVHVLVVMLEHGDRPGDSDAGMVDVVLKEVGAEELLVGVHSDGDDLVDDLKK